MQSDFEQRIDAIDWCLFETAYGIADDVPKELKLLFSKDESEAKYASHKLWCGLCHQHAFVSSAALPALPFLWEVIESTSDELKIEILDIFLGFAKCSVGLFSSGNDLTWLLQLKLSLVSQLPRFYQLAEHSNEEISEFAQQIIDQLQE